MTQKLETTYNKLKLEIQNEGKFVKKRNESTFQVEGDLFFDILEKFPPRLKQEEAQVPLETVYNVGFHTKTQALFICDKGAYLLSKAPKSNKYYAMVYTGFIIYSPNHGIEIVDVGIAGDVVNSDYVILRPESACSPSFIMGSQRCNCHDQWIIAAELAAYYNPLEINNTTTPEDLEHYITSYFRLNENQVPVPKHQGRGVILIHMDSQNGMGSGVSAGKYTSDLNSVAFMRHRGEYVTEQIHGTSMAEAFTALGLTPDPRKLNDSYSYKIPGLVLDYFGISQSIIVLTNNRDKVEALKKLEFNAHRIQVVGRSDIACGIETEARREEFLHDIPRNFYTSLKADFKRVIEEIHKKKQNEDMVHLREKGVEFLL